ncbi:MAG TPA: DUF1385 domain-containing protein [Firmicutes bacterium]|nr:DUF1385 domain-containing protein [Candidatus Fermentithermobacillaceae bacterium]
MGARSRQSTRPAGSCGELPARSYGGQAVIEGVMIKGRKSVTLAVRTSTGDIVVETDSISPLRVDERLLAAPVVRGAIALVDSLVVGIKAIFRSAELASPKESGRPGQTQTGSSTAKAWMFPLIGLAVALAVALFVVIPVVVTSLLLRWTGVTGKILTNFIETAIRLLILGAYVALVSRAREIQRVLQYHGAEHKVIWAWETFAGDVRDFLKNPEEASKLLSDKARSMSRVHPRCGTSFLFLAVIAGALVFSLVSPEGLFLRMVARIVLLPVVAGLAYEILKASPGKKGPVFSILRAPGLVLQKMTTREPDDDEIEVAALALAHLLRREEP